jgi:hypothetical protein
MSEPDDTPENFLQRWSRRKQAAESRAPDGTEAALQSQTDADADAPESAAEKADVALPTFDPKLLPPIESINAASDVRAFLAPGVPEELTRAALRRAWATDPTIRDFIGLAENQWDFTNPDSIPGFGTLEFTDDIRRMVAGLVGGPTEQRSAPQSGAAAEQFDQIADKPGETASPEAAADPDLKNPHADLLPGREDLLTVAETSPDVPQVELQISDSDAAAQNNIDAAGPNPHAAHRKHGGAVPK